jgi:hypothetical protein
MSKLTERQVREIRRRYAAGDGTYLSLANDYDVGNGTIGAIVQGRTWRHLLPATV